MFFVWLYTRQGGVKSLIWTDTLKTFCLVASLVLSIVFIMRGWVSFADTAREVSASPMSRIFFFDDPASGRYFWKNVRRGYRPAGGHDRTRSGHDAAQFELRHAARLAERTSSTAVSQIL